ncbi:site-2 protease family protein [Oscillatoria salina]|uniref:site-2 protease family protein n=1 Tax=Oscillatoria salina TaxID=331517 RepID=UPI001CCF511A|nr:site-2 protease family protein [Oscillatoria salina]MBZ8181143.1 site-2 protease family protein [Oscillatoria salina IIICB1]
MLEFLLLIVLSVITYIIVKRSVAGITRTPIWLLWLVMMTPAFVWTAWIAYFGKERPIPPLLAIAPFVLCPLVYWWLIGIGRRNAPKTPAKPDISTGDPEKAPLAASSEDSSKVRPITTNEEKLLRNCFPWGIYYLQNLDYRPQAILCRGKLRSNPEVAYKTIKENITEKFGDRFLLIFQEGFKGQPFFALVPNPRSQSQDKLKPEEKLTRPSLALALLFITLFTTTTIGAEIAGVSLEALQQDPSLLLQGLPYSLSIVGILGIHEFGHYLTAKYYQIRTTLPYFIPIPFFLGTFGAFIQMRSPVPNRKALFDVSLAGPLAGFIASVPILLWGLSLSEIVPLTDESGLLNIESIDPRYSFLLAVLSKIALGTQFTPQAAIDLHPIAFAGYVGIVVTALNLMPVGQLDGGHIVHAMFGQRTAIGIAQVARLLMLGLALVQSDFLLWAIILWLMPIADEPALNDVTELDNKRDFIGLLALTLLVIILLPVPATISQWLNF